MISFLVSEPAEPQAPPRHLAPPPWGLRTGWPCWISLQIYMLPLALPIAALPPPPPHTLWVRADLPGRLGSHHSDSSSHSNITQQPYPTRPTGQMLFNFTISMHKWYFDKANTQRWKSHQSANSMINILNIRVSNVHIRSMCAFSLGPFRRMQLSDAYTLYHVYSAYACINEHTPFHVIKYSFYTGQ